MRMRAKKHVNERLERCAPLLIKTPFDYRGGWSGLFNNQNPIRIEIGCGKGGFIIETASQNPDINFIALEREKDCLVMAAEGGIAAGLLNLRFILGDAGTLDEIFAPGECSLIYLNFSDPWRKARHYKRRLTYRSYLEIYDRVLSKDGEIRFKTDNRPLFDFSLEELRYCGFSLSGVTFDLHNDYPEGNIMTEYESRFTSMGVPICHLVARPLR